MTDGQNSRRGVDLRFLVSSPQTHHTQTYSHLTGHLRIKEELSNFFGIVNCLFAKVVNKRLKRRGQVVMDRSKSPLIESDDHMLTVMAYIDLNLHGAKKVSGPDENEWSSYGYYTHGREDPLITPSPPYLALGSNDLDRRSEYRAIVAALMAHRKLMIISHTYFIGNPDWVAKKYRELCERLGRRPSHAMTGRPLGPPR